MKSNGFQVRLRHTQITEIDEKAHVLPPDCGPVKEYQVADYFCPENWSNDGVFVEVEEGMPFWIDLRDNGVCAVIPSIQRLNPITGEPADLEKGLCKDPKQNYLRLPNQLWMDGFAKEGKVYQFIVTKAGIGLAVNEYVLPVHMRDSHALGFAFFAPKDPPPVIPVIMEHHNHHHYNNDWYHWQWYYYYNHSNDYYLPNNQWFSPLHTPQNWQIKSTGSVMRSLDNALIVGASGATQRFTQNRVTDNYNEVLDNTLDDAPAADSLCCFVDEDTKSEAIDHTQFDKASIGMGGRIEQEIKVDSDTIEFYKKEPSVIMPIYLALPEQFKAIMSRGKRQDASRTDRYVHSGEVGGIQVPLIKVLD